MALKCPNCNSPYHRNPHIAKSIGGTIGTLAGAAGGAFGFWGAARIGLMVGTPAGPAGAALGAVCAATLRGIIGATAGCEIGATLGQMIDRHVLDIATCKSCGAAFSDELPQRGFYTAHAARDDVNPMDPDGPLIHEHEPGEASGPGPGYPALKPS